MVEAGGPGPAPAPATAPNPVGSVDQGYSSYPGHSSMYSAPSANAGPPTHPGGGYGSAAYGTNYGY